jgi:hypothetical protein
MRVTGYATVYIGKTDAEGWPAYTNNGAKVWMTVITSVVWTASNPNPGPNPSPNPDTGPGSPTPPTNPPPPTGTVSDPSSNPTWCGSSLGLQSKKLFGNGPDIRTAAFEYAVSIQRASAKSSWKAKSTLKARDAGSFRGFHNFLRFDNPYWWWCGGGMKLYAKAFGTAGAEAAYGAPDCVSVPAWGDNCATRDRMAKAWRSLTSNGKKVRPVIKELQAHSGGEDVMILLEIDTYFNFKKDQLSAVRELAANMPSMYSCATTRGLSSLLPSKPKALSVATTTTKLLFEHFRAGGGVNRSSLLSIAKQVARDTGLGTIELNGCLKLAQLANKHRPA